ncbi:serine hydrolase domain-containing protein [Rathayibacter soli]|uniref:serine hydrolase domain-containing protein n=1 Tax=Rathayibacter soli TaxID=3144168 RepID=UPI0027E5849C|nr:serine hydrolase domain-containing protein [Glaciibacter superstes]
MNHAPLPASTPSAQGVDARGILRFLDALEGSPTQDPHSLMILRHGQVIAQGWWTPYAAQRRHLLYSLSKSFTSAAAGIAISEGLLNLDATAISYFPEFDADVTDARSRSILVRHLASMATGHTFDTLAQAGQADPENLVRGFLMLPPERDPGTYFAYNQPATYTLAAIIQKKSGLSLADYLRPRLLDPLGIGPIGWQQYPPGQDLGFSGLFATTDAIARLGQLHLQRGTWNGTQLLPEEWVEQAGSFQIATTVPFPDDPSAGPDWRQGYGFQFWMSRHGYRGDGACGQFCLILPEQDAVIAITSQTNDMQETLDIVWRELLPALSGVGTPSADADDRLRARMDALQLPLPPGSAKLPDSVGHLRWSSSEERAYRDQETADEVSLHSLMPVTRPTEDVSFTPVGGSCEAQPSLHAVHVAQQSATWRVTLVDESGELSALLKAGEWNVADAASDLVPIAVAGGWSDQQHLRFDVVFIETPHRLQIACDITTHEFTAHWVTTPLHLESTPLSDLKTPPPLG